MKPYNPGGHSAYQERLLAQLRKYYPDTASSLPALLLETLQALIPFMISTADR